MVFIGKSFPFMALIQVSDILYKLPSNVVDQQIWVGEKTAELNSWMR